MEINKSLGPGTAGGRPCVNVNVSSARAPESLHLCPPLVLRNLAGRSSHSRPRPRPRTDAPESFWKLMNALESFWTLAFMSATRVAKPNRSEPTFTSTSMCIDQPTRSDCFKAFLFFYVWGGFGGFEVFWVFDVLGVFGILRILNINRNQLKIIENQYKSIKINRNQWKSI